MKAKLIPILVCTCILALLTNCTVEKRLFQKGYHIEWKKKPLHHQVPDEPGNPPLSPDEKPGNETTEKQSIPDQHTGNKFIPIEENIPETSAFSPVEKTGTEPGLTTQKIDSPGSISLKTETVSTLPDPNTDDDPAPQTEQKLYEPVGIVSFSFYFLGFGVGLLAFVAANPVAVLGFTALIVLVSLILGIISVVRFHKHKDRFRGNFFGYFGLFASAATLIFGIIALTFYAILLLSSWPG